MPETPTTQVWESVLSEIKQSVSAGAFKTWFGGTSIAKLTDSENQIRVEIVCPNNFCKQQLSLRYRTILSSAFFKFLKKEVVLDFVVDPKTGQEEGHVSQIELTVQPAPFVKTIFDGLNPSHTFEKFVVGPSNNLAFAAAQAVVAATGSLYNPLFIWGGVGVGKTHLMQSIGNAILTHKEGAKIIYTTCEMFTNEFIDSLRSRQTRSFRDRFRRADVLLLDDVQFLTGREATQEEFFHTFNELYQSSKQIVLTSDRHPSEIGKLEDRLVSRFLGGLTVDVGQPDFEMRAAIIYNKCAALNIEIGKDVVDFLAEHVDRNVRELEGALTHIVSISKLLDQKPTLALAQSFFSRKNNNPAKIVSPKQIVATISRFFDIKTSDLLGQSRSRKFVKPRQVAMFLLREQLGMSLTSIGEVLGGRDHTTVIHGLKAISLEASRFPQVASDLEEIRKEFLKPEFSDRK